MAKDKTPAVHIITEEFRVSYPSLFQARKANPGDPNAKAKFSVSMIFRVAETPESKARGEKVVSIKPLKDAVATVLLAKLGAGWAAEIQKRKGDGAPVYHVPFRDGNSTEKKDSEGYGPGTVFIGANSDYKPGVVDANKNEILNPHDVYPGCYARAQVQPHWYDVNGNKGVSFWIENVQKIRDGEPLGGGVSAQDAFDAIPAPGGDAMAGVGAGAASTNSDPLAGI